MGSDVINFYRNKTIFLTGGTGFLGVHFIEKLLFTCEFKKLYLLMRPQKGVMIHDRLNQLFNKKVFTYRCQGAVDQKRHLVVPIAGDITLPDLGMSDLDTQTIMDEVNIVIHSAAAVNFDEPLSDAVTINIDGSKLMIKLVEKCHQLESFIYISTGFTHSGVDRNMEEDRRPPPMTLNQLEQMKMSNSIDDFNGHIWDSIKGDYPNTYCFTKCISEANVIQECEKKGINYAVIRPSIVFAAVNEPAQGFIEDGSQAFAKVIMAVSLGMLPLVTCGPESRFPVVGVDTVINAILIVGMKMCHTLYPPKSNDRILGVHGSLIGTYDFMDLCRHMGRSNPSKHTLLRPGLMMVTRYQVVYDIVWFFYVNLFWGIMDLIPTVKNRKFTLKSTSLRFKKIWDLAQFFGDSKWTLYGDRIHHVHTTLNNIDRMLFPVNDFVDYKQYLSKSWSSLRRFVMKETDEDTKIGMKHVAKLDLGIQTVKWFLAAITAYIMYPFIPN